MGRPTKRTQHCRELASKRRKPADSLYMYNTITDNAFINDNCYFTDDVIEDESSEFEVYEWNDNRLDDEAEDLYKVLIQNMSNLPTSSRYQSLNISQITPKSTTSGAIKPKDALQEVLELSKNSLSIF